MDDIVREQIDYYRSRAAEYDEWWFRRGRYELGAERNALWRREVAVVETALHAANPRGTILDIACGTGLWTRHLARRADRVTAIDTSREMIEINRARVAAANVDYVEADIFSWRAQAAYDFIFFGFWISHIPRTQWDAFWALLADALAPGGTVFFVDNRRYAFSIEVSARRDNGDDEIETRILNDGRRFTIVKNFFEPAPLEAEFAARGWRAAVRETETFFIYGSLVRATTGPRAVRARTG